MGHVAWEQIIVAIGGLGLIVSLCGAIGIMWWRLRARTTTLQRTQQDYIDVVHHAESVEHALTLLHRATRAHQRILVEMAGPVSDDRARQLLAANTLDSADVSRTPAPNDAPR